jgi:hypothetical protein
MNPTYPYTADDESFAEAIRAALTAIARSWGVEP